MMKTRLHLSGFTLLASLLFTSPAQAIDKASCTPVDLRPEMGPIRDQGDIGWCYANAAADLLSHKLRHELNGQPVSAGYTALNYLRVMNKLPNVDGGYVTMAVFFSDKLGICPRAMEDKLQFSGLTKLSLNERIDALMAFKRDYDRYIQNSDEAAFKRFMKQYRLYIKTDSVIAQFTKDELSHLLYHSTEKSFINEFAKLYCGDQVKVPHTDIKVAWGTQVMTDPFTISKKYTKYIPGIPTVDLPIPAIRWNNFDLMSVIDDQMSKKNPIAIDYYSRFLKTDFIKEPFAGERAGRHASVIVGRRWSDKSNSCEYLIRNSWGNQCYSYQRQDQCEGGNIWVPEQVLRYNAFAFSYIR